TITIPTGSRAAFVSRTGSSKRTVIAALTGIGDVVSSRISIDGINTTSVGSKLLRNKIAFMPQEAAVLSGTLRYNLDPFGEHDDADLWRRVKGVESSKPTLHLDLDTPPITSEGANLSSGPRSLISLARALVKDAAILVLDEATASMDAELDHRVQQILRTNLQGKTSIVVAHRLDSVVGSSDLICVMDEGSGLFHTLCSNAGNG
ncbi:uncharacterized protein MYCFIDRAFT_44825, partial [Pseudocercospora fijiensis CIRAD86]